MEYNFDEIIERKGTDTYKYAHIQKVCGREDVLPMWVADMDFKTPPFVMRAIENRLKQPALQNRIMKASSTGVVRISTGKSRPATSTMCLE